MLRPCLAGLYSPGWFLAINCKLSAVNFSQELTMKNDLSRREFLQRSAGATGAFAASPRIFLQPEHIPLPLQSTPPSERVRFGIIGIGMQGSGLLTNAIQLSGVYGVASADHWTGSHELALVTVSTKIPSTR